MTDTTETPRDQNRELADLKREIIESRNLIIKTDNLLKNLQAELKNVAKKGADQYSRTWLATGVAYAIFAVMAIAIGVLATHIALGSERTRVERAETAMSEAQKSATDARTALETESRSAAQRQAASVQAMNVYKQLSSSRMEARLKGLEASIKLDQSLLSDLEKAALSDRSQLLRQEASADALEKARAAYRRQEMTTAAESFERYFSFQPDGPEVSNAHFLAGAAYFENKAFAKAVSHLEVFTAGGKTQKNHDYGMALLGQALERLGETDKALSVYEKGLIDHPSNSVMKNRRTVIQRNAKQPSAADQPTPQPISPIAKPPAVPASQVKTMPATPSAPAQPSSASAGN